MNIASRLLRTPINKFDDLLCGGNCGIVFRKMGDEKYRLYLKLGLFYVITDTLDEDILPIVESHYNQYPRWAKLFSCNSFDISPKGRLLTAIKKKRFVQISKTGFGFDGDDKDKFFIPYDNSDNEFIDNKSFDKNLTDLKVPKPFEIILDGVYKGVYKETDKAVRIKADDCNISFNKYMFNEAVEQNYIKGVEKWL